MQDALRERFLPRVVPGEGQAPVPWGIADDLPGELSCVRRWCVPDGDPLPDWAHDAAVGRLAQDLRQQGCDPPPMGCVAGPGVLWGFVGLANMWAFFLYVPALAYGRSSCPSIELAGTTGGLAIVDDLPLFLVVAVVGTFSLVLQRNCMRFSVVPQLLVTRKFDLLGYSFNHFPFSIWFLFVSLLHAFSWLDMLANAEVLAKTLKTRECPGYADMTDIWDRVIEQSFLRLVPGLGMDIGDLAIAGYVLLLTQPIYALMCSVPLERGVDYVVGMGKGFKLQYKTLYDKKNNHGAVLQVLAEACRMEAITFQDLTYAHCKMEIVLHQGKNGQAHSEWQFRYYHLAHVEIQRGFSRFFLFGLLQTAVQANLQMSLMAISKEVTGVTDSQNMFSVILTLLGCLLDLPDGITILLFARGVFKGLDDDLELTSDALRERGIIKRKLFLLTVCLFGYIACVAYAFLKMAGFFLCDHHLINLSGCAVW